MSTECTICNLAGIKAGRGHPPNCWPGRFKPRAMSVQGGRRAAPAANGATASDCAHACGGQYGEPDQLHGWEGRDGQKLRALVFMGKKKNTQTFLSFLEQSSEKPHFSRVGNSAPDGTSTLQHCRVVVVSGRGGSWQDPVQAEARWR